MTDPVNAYTFLITIISRIRAIHRKDPAGYCRECTVGWPCPTYKICTLQDHT